MHRSWKENLCRICAQNSSHNVALIEECYINSKQITLLEALNIFTNCPISLEDGLPQFICLECCNELKESYRFYLKVQASECELNGSNILEQDLVTKFPKDIDQFMRDPLEDSDVEDTHLDTKAVLSESNSDSEDDNRPLKELIDREKRKSILTDTESDCLQEEKEHVENLPDLVISAEEQIFPKGRFKCKVCQKAYFTTQGLKAHLEVHLPVLAKTKKKRSRGLAKRQRIISNEHQNEATNSTISKGTENSENVVEEDSKKLGRQKVLKPKKLFPCQVCGKQMISASKLRYHMVMHTGEKDYLCAICPKAYSTIYALKHHMRAHTGERPYECQFCGDRFTRPTTLKSHMRRHTGERPYGCDICGKRFIQHSSMTTHMKLNHMAKTIPCPHCDKKYARQTDLNTHLLSHSGEKPFSCQLCPSRFIRQANLNKHMNQQHAGRPNQELRAIKKPILNGMKVEQT